MFHIDHALRFFRSAPCEPVSGLDLGSGGGIPGLVLALAWPNSAWTFLDAKERKTDFIQESLTTLGIQERSVTVWARAEEVGSSPDFKYKFDLVTARGFGPPGVVAECASPLLVTGGTLLVSEPPVSEPLEESGRWDSDGLAKLGLVLTSVSDDNIAVLEQTKPCPKRYPRRSGVPLKRPLF